MPASSSASRACRGRGEGYITYYLFDTAENLGASYKSNAAFFGCRRRWDQLPDRGIGGAVHDRLTRRPAG